MLSKALGPLVRQLLATATAGVTPAVPISQMLCQQLRGAFNEPGPNQTKLFLGNLPWAITDEELSAEFSKYGTIHDLAIVKEKGTQRSRGIGFITIDASQAETAIKEMDGATIGGRPIKVAMSTSTGAARAEGGGGGGGFRPRPQGSFNRGGYGGGGYGGRGADDGGRGGGGGYRDREGRGGGGGYRDREERGGGGYRDRGNRGDRGGPPQE